MWMILDERCVSVPEEMIMIGVHQRRPISLVTMMMIGDHHPHPISKKEMMLVVDGILLIHGRTQKSEIHHDNHNNKQKDKDGLLLDNRDSLLPLDKESGAVIIMMGLPNESGVIIMMGRLDDNKESGAIMMMEGGAGLTIMILDDHHNNETIIESKTPTNHQDVPSI
jgi:hypothetical protein